MKQPLQITTLTLELSTTEGAKKVGVVDGVGGAEGAAGGGAVLRYHL